MARAKKKEELTLEEKLERALAPAKEQPYEVPGNWCWVRLGSVSEIYTGNSINEKIKREKYLNQPEGLNFIATKDIDFDNFIEYDNGVKINDYNKFKIAPEKTSLLCIEGGSAGRKLGFTDEKVCFGNKLCAFVSKGCVSKYIYYYLQTNVFHIQFSNQRHGLIGGVSVKSLSNFVMPMAYMAEQQRIVDRIESLFAKLDEVKEKVQFVVDAYEVRKTSILQKAVSGELTKGWRTKHGISRMDWKTISLKECGTWFGGGTPTTSKNEYWDGGTILWITSKDMKDRLLEDSLVHITQEGVNNSSAQYCDKPAVLFVMRSGILRRTLPICMVNVPFTVNQDLKAVIPEKIQQEYMYWACTAFEKDIREKCMKSGTTVESIETKKLLKYEIPLPSKEEQKVIVDVIKTLVNKEDIIKQTAEAVFEKLELIKKSILAKAFRGELGTNDPEEESSVELLKQILEQGEIK